LQYPTSEPVKSEIDFDYFSRLEKEIGVYVLTKTRHTHKIVTY